MATASSATVRSAEVPEFARAAAAYALKELARRAGVSADFYRTWRMDTSATGFVNVYVEPGTDKRIRFSRASPEYWKQIREGVFRTSRAMWMWRPEKTSAIVPDFRVPFSSLDEDDIGCLFSIADEDCVECPVDLLASTMLTLARFEETLPSARDQHDRFSALSSVAWRDRFLDRPIIDELGLGLEQAISHLLPRWKPQERRLRVKLSHDVDEIGLPFTLRGAVGHLLRRRHPAWAMRDLLAPVTNIETTYQLLLRQIVALSTERGMKPAVYWKASAPGPNDTGYNPRHRAIRSMIEDFRARGVEMGIHPGYGSYRSRETLLAEVSALQELFGTRQLGGRQDYLRWEPQTWIEWESLGLAYDSSVGFADRIGFRAGTCYPFRPWILSEHRESNLLEIPLLAMDETFYSHQRMEPAETLVKLRELVARCRAVGGVFTLLWHNTRIVHRGFLHAYQTLLDELAGTDNYNWETDYDRRFDGC
jgi:hypothetical protein